MSLRRHLTLAAALASAGSWVAASPSALAEPTAGPYGHYTTTADFATGVATAIDADFADQLTIDDTSNPFNFVWVANSAAGTIVKIDATTGAVLGEYLSAPNGMGRNPSRTTVDNNGNVWVGNRDERGVVNAFAIQTATAQFPATPPTTRRMGSVVHIRLLETGGCQDRNGNGVIDTSTGLGDIKPWPNNNGTDALGLTMSAQDECIVYYVRTNSDGTRHVSVNQDNDVWVGGFRNENDYADFYSGYDLIETETGKIVRHEPGQGVDIGGYGGIVDKNGVLWSSNRGRAAGRMLRWQTAQPLTGSGGDGGNWKTVGATRAYGICADRDGDIWVTQPYEGLGLYQYSPTGVLKTGPSAWGSGFCQGCTVDAENNVWLACNDGYIAKFNQAGAKLGQVNTGYIGPSGVSIDGNGKIWVSHRNVGNPQRGRLARVDRTKGANGTDGKPLGEIDFWTVYIGSDLYNYSDMTGQANVGTPTVGSWTVIHDGGTAGTLWENVSWTSLVPNGAVLEVRVAASNTPATFPAGTSISSGQSLLGTGLAGRYLQVSVQLGRNAFGVSPVVYDLTVRGLGCDCYVDGACFGDGTVNPENACQTCDADFDRLSWTNKVNGSACDDGNACTFLDRCNALAQCVAIPYSCDDGNACTGDVCKGDGTCAFTLSPNALPDDDCDGFDDNCNGTPDEGWTEEFVQCGQGACANSIVTSCNAGVLLDVCLPKPPVALVDSTCDGVDDDCDGQTDDDFVTTAVSCGRGQCASTGTLTCSGDQAINTCVAGIPSAEGCDGLDNDCDGVVDNDPLVASGSICPAIDTVIDSAPQSVTAVHSASFTYSDSVTPDNSRFECAIDGGAWASCDGGAVSYGELADGQHVFQVRAVRGDGAVDPTPAYFLWEVDSTTPDTLLLVSPTDPSQDPDATFLFGTTDPGPVTYFCVLEAGADTSAPPADAYDPCDPLTTFDGLADGPYTLWVYVVNAAGTADPEPATWSWDVDTTVPDTRILAHPAVASNTAAASFTYDDPTDPALTTFLCRLDGQSWGPCNGGAKTYAGLQSGTHTFFVAAIDASGNLDPIPATFTWTIDLVGPSVFIADRPTNPHQTDTADFRFVADEDVSGFFCAVDFPAGGPVSGDFAACDPEETFTDLSDGVHTLCVHAVDAAGNVGPDTCYSWTIDTSFPETAFTQTPALQTGPGDGATFGYHDPTDAAVTHFECSLDGAAFATCDGGTKSYAAAQLAEGDHTFRVRACQLTTGQCDPTPATFAWVVTQSPCPLDKTAPTVACPADVQVECVAAGGSTDASGLAPTGTDSCGDVTVEGNVPERFGLGATPVIFHVSDGNGNVATCAPVVTVVDTTPPTITCPANISVSTPTAGCLATVALGEVAAADGCYAEGVTVYHDAPPAFPVGVTTVTHTAMDGAGLRATCTQTVTVVDDVPLTLTCPAAVTEEAPADSCTWDGTLAAEARDNCAVDVTLLSATEAWPVGVHDVAFDAEDAGGNDASCTTVLTVRDVTAPSVACPALPDALPAIAAPVVVEACGAEIAFEGFSCKVALPDGTMETLTGAACPAEVALDRIVLRDRVASGTLTVAYTVRATDPSGNTTTADCAHVFAGNADSDDVPDVDDNCPAVANPDQVDSDSDGVGDLCQDSDGDGVLDTADNCVDTANPEQQDFDEDGLGNACDPVDDTLTLEGGGGCTGGALPSALGLALVVLWAMTRRRRA